MYYYCRDVKRVVLSLHEHVFNVAIDQLRYLCEEHTLLYYHYRNVGRVVFLCIDMFLRFYSYLDVLVHMYFSVGIDQCSLTMDSGLTMVLVDLVNILLSYRP